MYTTPPPWQPDTKPIHPPSIPFLTIIKNGWLDWRKYNARSSRREFWLWALHVVLIIYPAIFLLQGPKAFSDPNQSNEPADTIIGFGILIFLVPSLSMWVRRIHDTGHRIWWCLIPFVGVIINIVLLCSRTDLEENRWTRTTRT